MSKIKLVKIIKAILPILKFYPWGIPTIIILGLITSLVEGIGISLLIPFFNSLESGQSSIVNNPFLSQIDNFLEIFEPQKRVIIITSLILSSILLKVFLSFLYIALCKWLQYQTLHKLRLQVYQKLIKADQSFFDQNKTGELINLIDRQTFQSSQALNFFIWLNINLCMIVIFSLLLLLISWQSTLLVTLAFVLISVISYMLTQKTSTLSKQAIQTSIKLSDLALESFTGIKTIKAFRREQHEEKYFEKASLKDKNLNIKLNIEIGKVDPIVEGLAVALLVVVMFINLTNALSLPVLVTFIFMLYRLQPQVKQLNSNLTFLIASINSIEKIYYLLDTADKTYIISGNKNFYHFQKGITFDAVSFYYEGKNQPALANISLFIPQGKTTALVGSSGGGKSTLINLIFRFYDVTSGTIYIDDYPLKELNLSSWRSQIALVSQDVHIFSDTVKKNIAYGCPDATDEEIITAAKQAHCDEFIRELSQGYNTFVGDKGVLLSGGQKQRISIARAILCNPEILILDEATNALDNISEKLIQESINLLSQNRTVIVIAHRLSTIENADKIIVFKKGKIVEEGSLKSLLEAGHFFKEMYQLEK